MSPGVSTRGRDGTSPSSTIVPRGSPSGPSCAARPRRSRALRSRRVRFGQRRLRQAEQARARDGSAGSSRAAAAHERLVLLRVAAGARRVVGFFGRRLLVRRAGGGARAARAASAAARAALTTTTLTLSDPAARFETFQPLARSHMPKRAVPSAWRRERNSCCWASAHQGQSIPFTSSHAPPRTPYTRISQWRYRSAHSGAQKQLAADARHTATPIGPTAGRSSDSIRLRGSSSCGFASRLIRKANGLSRTSFEWCDPRTTHGHAHESAPTIANARLRAGSRSSRATPSRLTSPRRSRPRTASEVPKGYSPRRLSPAERARIEWRDHKRGAPANANDIHNQRSPSIRCCRRVARAVPRLPESRFPPCAPPARTGGERATRSRTLSFSVSAVLAALEQAGRAARAARSARRGAVAGRVGRVAAAPLSPSSRRPARRFGRRGPSVGTVLPAARREVRLELRGAQPARRRHRGATSPRLIGAARHIIIFICDMTNGRPRVRLPAAPRPPRPPCRARVARACRAAAAAAAAADAFDPRPRRRRSVRWARPRFGALRFDRRRFACMLRCETPRDCCSRGGAAARPPGVRR